MPPAETVDPQLPPYLAKTVLHLTPGGEGHAPPVLQSEGERYEDRGLLGSGGMGEVRLGKDRRVGREVAIKVIRSGSGASADARLRFVREARVQGQLEHPSIVPVYDLAISDRGDAYFTMKRIRGKTLESVLDGLRDASSAAERKYTRRRLLTAFSSVCLSVDFAHSRGVLHRDLKPSNIMLGDFGEVYVLDWGIAKVMGTPESERGEDLAISAESPPTAAGSVLGTAGYMPPEQIRGDALDERADVYALGAILYEILSWEPLHPQESVDSIVRSTLAGADARVTKRAPLRDVPPELEAICLRATASSPDERFRGARELSDAVERFLDGDRDLELRREMAENHARAAADLARRALDSRDATYEPRRSAMQEVGRALAFEPSHAGARETLVRLLTTAPSEMPREAIEERDASRAAQERLAARIGSGAYAAWLFASVFPLWMGVRDWLAFAVFVAAQALAAAACAWRAHAIKPGGASSVAVRVASALATLSMCTIFGPLVLVPTVALGTTMTMLLHPERRARLVIVTSGCAVVAVPIALQVSGAIPASYTFEGGAMLVRPWMTVFPEGLTTFIALLASVSTIAVSAILIMQVRDALTSAEHRLAMHAWHLRQLVPKAPEGGDPRRLANVLTQDSHERARRFR